MKKLLVIALLIAGCEQKSSQSIKETKSYRDEDLRIYRILNIDGCEYIKMETNYTIYIVHKGNCSNPIHQHDYFRTPNTAFGKMSTENDGQYPRILPPTFKARIKGDEPEVAYKYQDTTYIGYVSGIIRENIVLRQRLKKIQKQKSTEYIIEIDTFQPKRPDLLHREPTPYSGRGRMLPEWIQIGDTFIKQ